MHLHSGSKVKLLTLAAAAKQPSILPSPKTGYNQCRSGLSSFSPITWWYVSAELLKVKTASCVKDGINIYVGASALYDQGQVPVGISI